jgi:hypothetical protein
MSKQTNWLAVIAAAVAAMGIGFLWYGFLFNQEWMGLHGMTMQNDKIFKDGKELTDNTPMIVNTVVMIVYALFLNWLINKTGDTTLVRGATLGFAIGVIMLLGILVGNMFATSSMANVKIDGSYSVVMWTVMGAILGAWRKKGT